MLLRVSVLLLLLLVGPGVGGVSAATGDELRPNLQALPASDIQVQTTSDGRTLLLFSATSKNVGTGPLELVAKQVIGDKQEVDQRVYLQSGGYVDYPAGQFVYHPEHNHFHFEQYAYYELQLDSAPGSSLRTGSKTTFCILDSMRIDTRLAGAPKKAVYTTCGNQIQGMSVGWGDEYVWSLPGQSLDITGLADGIYDLRVTVDPVNRLVETDDTDNVSQVRLQLSGGTVTVLDGRKGSGGHQGGGR
ncbi:MAG TPA: lysyl oxidase family protein [Thermomicrobiales bacterium]|nr:lysyl oxidase family protein [Thermomicrobiales bacterium]